VTSDARSSGAAEAARRLAAYLNGTHSGAHTVLSHRRVTPPMVVEAFGPLDVAASDRGEQLTLGRDRWIPTNDAERRLRDSLARCLGTDAVIDLVLFGSIARGSTTGYSDVDAILVVSDDLICDSRRFRALRTRVLAAERAVLSYQPMQHHGFLVATPRLLRDASTALGLPAEAIETTSSLFGRLTEAIFEPANGAASERFRALARSLRRIESWPDHPWELHRTVALFELVPALYVQATGRPCAKHESFHLARETFPGQWRPYDLLDEVRRSWPREPRPALEHAASALRNPWTAVALWRRLPSAVPSSVGALLTDERLRGLQAIVASMAARIR
jgi:hypothetical protein